MVLGGQHLRATTFAGEMVGRHAPHGVGGLGWITVWWVWLSFSSHQLSCAVYVPLILYAPE